MSEDKDLNIDDLDTHDDVKGGVGRPKISTPGIGRDLPHGQGTAKLPSKGLRPNAGTLGPPGTKDR